VTRVFFIHVLDIFWFGLPPAVLFCVVWRWIRSSPIIAEPAWRGYTSAGAVGLAATSVGLWVTSLTWARAIGGFGYYDPVLLGFFRWGSLTGLAGLAASLAGKGKLKCPTCGL
jgi:hypothetical protein